MHEIHPRTLRRMNDSKKASGPSAEVLAMVAQIKELLHDDDGENPSSDSDSGSDTSQRPRPKKQQGLSDAALQVIDELGSKMSFAEQNQKRKDQTYAVFQKDSFKEQCSIMQYMIRPLVTPMNLLMKRTAIISELMHLPESDTARKHELEQE